MTAWIIVVGVCDRPNRDHDFVFFQDDNTSALAWVRTTPPLQTVRHVSIPTTAGGQLGAPAYEENSEILRRICHASEWQC